MACAQEQGCIVNKDILESESDCKSDTCYAIKALATNTLLVEQSPSLIIAIYLMC